MCRPKSEGGDRCPSHLKEDIETKDREIESTRQKLHELRSGEAELSADDHTEITSLVESVNELQTERDQLYLQLMAHPKEREQLHALIQQKRDEGDEDSAESLEAFAQESDEYMAQVRSENIKASVEMRVAQDKRSHDKLIGLVIANRYSTDERAAKELAVWTAPVDDDEDYQVRAIKKSEVREAQQLVEYAARRFGTDYPEYEIANRHANVMSAAYAHQERSGKQAEAEAERAYLQQQKEARDEETARRKRAREREEATDPRFVTADAVTKAEQLKEYARTQFGEGSEQHLVADEYHHDVTQAWRERNGASNVELKARDIAQDAGDFLRNMTPKTAPRSSPVV